MSAVLHSRHVFRVTHHTCVLCHAADMSAVSHNRHVCCVKQQTCLLCHTPDMSAVTHSRGVCCVTQQTCLLCHTADKSAVSNIGHACCLVQPIRLLIQVALIRSMAHSPFSFLATCALFASTLILFGSIDLNRQEVDPRAVGQNDPLFLVCLQAHK